MSLWIPAAVAFIVAGTLEVVFLGLAVMGTLMGGVMTIGTLMGEFRGEEAFMGPLLFVIYGVWFIATAIAGPVHLVAGGSILAGKRNKTLLWAATGVSLLPMATVYCAPTATIAGVLGLLAAVLPDPAAAPEAAPAPAPAAPAAAPPAPAADNWTPPQA